MSTLPYTEGFSMHLGRRWRRTVVGATVLGIVGGWWGCGGGTGAPDARDCQNQAPGCSAPQPAVPPSDGTEAPPGPDTPGTTPPPEDGGPPTEPESPDPTTEAPPPAPGATVWLAREGTAQDDLALDMAVDAVSGDILTAAVDGLDDLQARNPSDDTVRLVLTRRSAAGTLRWTRTLDVRTPQEPAALRADIQAHVATDGAGNLVVAGTVAGTVDFGSGPLQDGAFLAKLDADGALLWVTTPRGAALTVADVAVDGRGRTWVAFNTEGTVDFGGAKGSRSGVVVYAADGRAERVLAVGRPETEGARVELGPLAVDGAGGLAVGGRFVGTVRFGAQGATSAKDGSPFLARYAEDGALTWAKVLAQARGTLGGVGMSDRGEVVATGTFLGTVAWGGTRMQGHAYRVSPFLVAVGPDGTERWSRDLGSDLQVGALAVRPSGEVVLAGYTYSMIENGVAGQDGLGTAQLFALRYDEAGQPLASRLFLADPPQVRGQLYGLESVPSVALLPDGDAVLFGHSDRSTDFGTGRRAPARGDVFLLRLKR